MTHVQYACNIQYQVHAAEISKHNFIISHEMSVTCIASYLSCLLAAAAPKSPKEALFIGNLLAMKTGDQGDGSVSVSQDC